MVLLAVHDGFQPGPDLGSVSCTLNARINHVHIEITVPDELHRSDEVLCCISEMMSERSRAKSDLQQCRRRTPQQRVPPSRPAQHLRW